MALHAVNPVIVDAINEKRRLSFTYHDKPRLVEPQCYGIGNTGKALLRVHQVRGGTQPEPLFEVSKIRDLVALDEHFTGPGPNYTRNDSAMKTIFARL